jgi:hypothetical protein
LAKSEGKNTYPGTIPAISVETLFVIIPIKLLNPSQKCNKFMTLANFLSIFYDYGFEKEQSTHIRLFFVMHSVDQEKLYGLIIKGEKKLFRHFLPLFYR